MKRAVRLFEEDFSVVEDDVESLTEEDIFGFYNKMCSYSVTENGALGLATTQHPLLDLNFKVSSLRSRSEEEITNEYVKAFYGERKYAVKWLFFLRDILQGMGERRTFRICLKFLAISHPEIAKAILELVPEYGRYDDLLVLLDTPMRKDVSAFFKHQFLTDLKCMKKGKPVSLLAKWLPSINTSSKETRRLAKMLAYDWDISPRIYRKTLAELRAYLDVLEVKISDGKWQEVDYEKVPAKASIKYEQAFLRHDEERRMNYLMESVLGNSKINIKGLVPHELVHRMIYNGSYGREVIPSTLLVEVMWKAMQKQGYKNEWGLEDCIVVADGSGSMYSRVDGNTSLTAKEVCWGLAIYFAEQLQGFYKDKVITFSSKPQFIDLSKGNSLKEKLEIISGYDECDNTNIEAVFDLLLAVAVSEKIPAEYMPKQVLVLSDMEFDMATTRDVAKVKRTLFGTIQQKYRQAGYQMPRLIFWNLCSRTNTIPMVKNDNGVCLLSGFSQNAMKVAADRTEKDPYRMLLKALDSPRYDKVEKALEKVDKLDSE